MVPQMWIGGEMDAHFAGGETRWTGRPRGRKRAAAAVVLVVLAGVAAVLWQVYA